MHTKKLFEDCKRFEEYRVSRELWSQKKMEIAVLEYRGSESSQGFHASRPTKSSVEEEECDWV